MPNNTDSPPRARKTLDAATVRRLATEAECDPRTIIKVLNGASGMGLSYQRARRVLVEARLLPDVR